MNNKKIKKMQKVSLSASINRWLFSTNAKDIAMLYFIFALFSGILGSLMSLVIRLELAAPGNQILGGNNQLFNVLVTAHAILMVFFLIMPVTMGFFGREIKEKVYSILFIKRNILTDNKRRLSDSKELGHYLAGLIEGDGTILVQENADKSKKLYNPIITIVFHKKDQELGDYLCKELNLGKIYEKKGNYVLWTITRIEEIYKLVCLINGKFRTPKYGELVRLINWINNYIELNKDRVFDLKNPLNVLNKKRLDEILEKIDTLPILDMDNSDINSNSWLSGFTDADGNFSISLKAGKKNHKSRVDLSYRLEIQQKSKKEVNSSYEGIMMKIASLFNTGIYARSRNLKVVDSLVYKEYKSYIVSVNSLRDLKIVDSYFTKYPLLSAKYLDYKDWSYLLNLYLNKETDNLFKLGQEIIKNYNKTRKIVPLNHIKENIYKKYT